MSTQYFNWIWSLFARCVNWLLSTNIVVNFGIGYLFITVFVFDVLLFYIIPSAGVEGGQTKRSALLNARFEKRFSKRHRP